MSSDKSRSVGRGGWRRHRIALVACLGLALTETMAVLVCYAQERIFLMIHAHEIIMQRDPTDGRFAFYSPGIDRPAVQSAPRARLGDDEAILGVQVGPKFRAYRLKAMLDPSRHIVNDLIDDHPVTVTYCDINDFAAGFTSNELGSPLSISQGGVFNGGMVLCVGQAEYAQQTRKPSSPEASLAAFPYATLPLIRTTWKLWRLKHPETDIYEGIPGDETKSD